MYKIIKIVAIVISVLSVIIFGLVIKNTDLGDGNNWVTTLIYISYFMLFACAVAALFYAFKNLVSNKHSLMTTLKIFGVGLILVIVSYLLSSGGEMTANDIVYSSTVTRWTEAGIKLTYFLGLIAVGALVWSSFNKIKK